MLAIARAVGALLAALALAGCVEPSSGSPGRLESLLARVPAEITAERVLYYTHLETGAGGFGSVLPLRDLGDTFGVEPSMLTDVLETGGVPLTLLAGEVEPDTVAAAATASGYDVVSEPDGWVRFTRPGTALPGSAPLVTAVPAGAVRHGLLVLGARGDVGAVMSAETRAGWILPLARSLDAAAAAALDGRARPFDEAARRRGTDIEGLLAQGRVTAPLEPYHAVALTWQPDGEFDGVPAEAGIVALVVGDDADGHEQAAALAVRAATAPVLGEQRRATLDLIEGGAPRFDPDTGVVRLPVRWRSFEPERLRDDLEAGHLLFLAPGQPVGAG